VLNLGKPREKKSKEKNGRETQRNKQRQGWDWGESGVQIFFQGDVNDPDVRFSVGKHIGGEVHSSLWFSQGQADPAQPTSLS